jgi:RNA polymerase sigma-70 factor (ECF subfamily)
MSDKLVREVRRLEAGDTGAAGRLLGLVYDDLRKLARSYMRRERSGHTLQPTALVHEAYLRVARLPNQHFHDRNEFVRVMAAYMRRALIDHARRKATGVRGGGVIRLDLDTLLTVLPAPDTPDDEMLRRLDELLDEFRRLYSRPARVFELRVMAGQSVDQASLLLGVSAGTVKRDFAFARAWFQARLER